MDTDDISRALARRKENVEAAEDVTDTLDAMKTIPVAPVEPSIPWWVTYLLWPFLKYIWRPWRRWGTALDIRAKLAICRWLGIIDSFSMAKSIDHGLRRDLDHVAEVLGDVIPVVNAHTPLLQDLRRINNRALVAMADRRKKEKPIEEKPS
jgi:hypothetical protein